MPYKVEVQSEATIRWLTGASGTITQEIRKRFRPLGKRLRDELRRQIPRVTGRARRGVMWRMGRRSLTTVAEIAVVLVYANLKTAPHLKTLEHGAMIRPVRGQFLTVPIGIRGRRRRTGPAVSAAQIRQAPEAYGLDRTWIAGTTILGETLAGDTLPLFELKESVLIKRREYFKRKARQRRRLITMTVQAGVRAALLRRVVDARG